MATLIPYVITGYADRMDQICARRYGSSANDVVIYAMNANPGIEAYGIVLPPGLKVLLPDLPATATTTTVRTQTQLWD